MKFLSLKENLASTFFPVILLEGNDHWIKNRAIEYISNAMDIQYRDINEITMDSCNNISDLIVTYNTLPFFSNQKLIVVQNIDFGNGKQQQVCQQLNDLVIQSDNTACLVIVCNESDSKYLANCSKATRVDCNRLAESDVVKWIIATCHASKCSIDRETAVLLSQYCLCDMSRISTELQKLISYDNSSVVKSTVEQLVTKDVEYAVYDLAQTIASKNVAKAQDMLLSLIRQGSDCRQLFPLMYNYYRRLYYTKLSTANDVQLAEQLGVKVYAVSFSRQTASKYSAMSLLRALSLFEKADDKLKSFVNELDTMQLLVTQLATLK